MQDDGVDEGVHLDVADSSGGVGQRVAPDSNPFDRQVGGPHQVGQHRVLSRQGVQATKQNSCKNWKQKFERSKELLEAY